MTNTFSAVSRWLEHRFQAVLLVVCVSGVVLHVVRSYLFFSIYRDEATQVAAATSLVDGYGLTIPQVRGNGTVLFLRKPMVEFPLGYPALFAGLLALTNDIVTATVLGGTIAATAFYVGAYIILSRIKVLTEPIASVAVALFWAFIWSPLHHLNRAEQLALSFFILSVACGLLTAVSRRWLAPLLFGATAMAVAVACRYAYWPLVTVVPLALVLSQGALRFRKEVVTSSLVMLAIPVVALCVIAWFNHSYGGRATLFRTAPVLREVHLENLLRCDAFPASAMGFTQALDWIGSKVPEILSQTNRRDIAWLVSAVLLGAAAASSGGVKWVRELLPFAGADLAPERLHGRFVLWCGTLTIAVTVAMLAYLSLMQPVSFPPFAAEYGWTPIQERRYFAPTHAFLALVFIVCLVRLALQNRRSSLVGLLIAIIVTAPAALNSGKDWVGCLVGYKGWGSAYGKVEKQSRYGVARGLRNEGWLCVSVSDQFPAERGYEFMGGAFPVHVGDMNRLSHVLRDRSVAYFFPKEMEEEVLAGLRFLEPGGLPRFERREIGPLGRNVVILAGR